MTIKIITRHAPSNYGSLLQSIATLATLKQLGHEAEIIDYIRKDERGLEVVLQQMKQKKEWSNNPLKQMLYVALRYPSEFLAERKFARMRKEFLALTQEYNTVEELKSLQADIFMTGSDQVWGPVVTGSHDPAYFLSFVTSRAKKIAYAASFGRTDFTSAVKRTYQEMLTKYNGIAVREDSAVELLEEMKLPCAGQVLDPTLLLTGEEWSRYIQKEIPGKYVLVYQLHNNPILTDYAKRFAAHMNLPLLRISPSLHQASRGGKFVYLPNIGDFLAHIKNATYFVTDSFHGTAFALNFNKQFIGILPNNKTGSRNQSILRLTGLENRIVTDYNDFSIAQRNIDYTQVNQILDQEREKSIEVLRGLCTKE